MIVVRIARLEERRNAVLQRHERRPNREQFVPRHRPIVRLAIQIAPLPHGRIGPAARLVRLRLQLHRLVVIGQFVALRQVTHHRVQPFAHASRKVVHLLRCAVGLLAALAVVVDVHVLVFGSLAAGVVGVTQTALAVHLAVRVPGGVVVGADQPPRIVLLRALGHADARRLVFVGLADATGAASDLGARINYLFFPLVFVQINYDLCRLL